MFLLFLPLNYLINYTQFLQKLLLAVQSPAVMLTGPLTYTEGEMEDVQCRHDPHLPVMLVMM